MLKNTLMSKRKLKNFLVFYVFISVFFVASYTFSRYVNTTSGSSEVGIAKFNVTVNDINVLDKENFEINFSEHQNFVSNKIAPNEKGYFEFIINPNQTEVSLEFDFTFDLSKLDEDFKLTYFTVNDSTTHYDILNNNLVKGNILLPSNSNSFTNSHTTSVKVYWFWDEKEDMINPDISTLDNIDMQVQAVIKQKI